MSVASQARQRPTIGWERIPRRKRRYPIRLLRGKAGTIIKATDRIYGVTSSGNFVRGYISQGDGKFHQQRRVRNHELRRAR